MTVAFRQAANTGATGIGGGVSLPVTLGSAALANSLLLYYAYYSNSSGTPTGPAGFTLLRSGGTGAGVFYVWYKIAAGGETTFGLTTAGSNNHLACVGVEYTGVSTSSPFDGEGETSVTAAGQSVDAPSVTAALPSGLLVCFFGAIVGSAGTTWTPPSGMTERADYQASSATTELSDVAVGAGGTGTKTATLLFDPGSLPRSGHSVVLARANTAPTAPTVTAPNGGETINNSVNITWTAGTDADGDSLVYEIDYSDNNGASWTSITASATGTSYAWTTSALPSSTTYLVRIRSKDTFGAVSAYDQSNAVFTIQHNLAPTAPTGLSPAAGTIDRAITQRFSWTFNDPNAGDTQSKFDLQYRIGAGAWTTVTVTTTSQFHDFAPSALSAATYEWQVRTYDALGVVSPWSASAFVTAANAPAAPTITSPTSGGTVGTSTGVVAWSAPAQASYQVRKVADSGGSADTGTVYYDSGEVVSSTARNAALTFPVNSRYEHLQVRIKVSGLWSTWASIRVQVSYTPPATPTVLATGSDSTASILVTPTQPTPTGTQPAVTSIDIRRRTAGDTSSGDRLAAQITPAPWRDYTPASGVAYEYQVVAHGANGVDASSAWTP